VTGKGQLSSDCDVQGMVSDLVCIIALFLCPA